VFENRVLRRIFGPKRDEVKGDLRKLHNEELHNLYSSPNIIRMIKSKTMRLARYVSRMGAMRNAYRILVGRHEGKRPLERPRRRWVDDIKIDLTYLLTYLLMYGAETFLRSCQLCSHSGNSQQF
jgi:hypothetical protein